MEHCCYQDLPNSRPQQGRHHIGQQVARSLLSAWSNSYDQADSETRDRVEEFDMATLKISSSSSRSIPLNYVEWYGRQVAANQGVGSSGDKSVARSKSEIFIGKVNLAEDIKRLLGTSSQNNLI